MSTAPWYQQRKSFFRSAFIIVLLLSAIVVILFGDILFLAQRNLKRTSTTHETVVDYTNEPEAKVDADVDKLEAGIGNCLLYTSPSPRD